MAASPERAYVYVNGFKVEPVEWEGMVYLTFAQAPSSHRSGEIEDMLPIAALVMRREVAADLAQRISKLLG
jgi:hypothetical protein